jgi:hypothetical protein
VVAVDLLALKMAVAEVAVDLLVVPVEAWLEPLLQHDLVVVVELVPVFTELLLLQQDDLVVPPSFP